MHDAVDIDSSVTVEAAGERLCNILDQHEFS
jgi:hypothetical protein